MMRAMVTRIATGVVGSILLLCALATQAIAAPGDLDRSFARYRA
jgi:hypothetical protein